MHITLPGCPLCETAERVRGGREPAFIAELSRTYMLLGENQGCRGWVVLVLKEHAEHMGGMSDAEQAEVFADVRRAAAAQRAVLGPVRINYECLGNVVAHVHWHLIPRHADDPAPKGVVWGWSAEALRGAVGEAERAELVGRLRGEVGG
jgi:diadenosine tetraphosphate (Ap4A) HIT family hydrolase